MNFEWKEMLMFTCTWAAEEAYLGQAPTHLSDATTKCTIQSDP